VKPLLSFLILVVFFWGVPAEAQVRQADPKWCQSHLPFGEPSPRLKLIVLCREGYAVGYDSTVKLPRWVAYVLTPREANGCVSRTRRFRPDPSLYPPLRAELTDYLGSGYDIGHLANNGDMRWSELVEAESNILSNTAPMTPTLNRGPWARLEDRTRVWAIERGPLLIYTGPIISRTGEKKIGNGVVVPSAFYKVIHDITTKETVAFIYPATASKSDIRLYQTTLQKVAASARMSFPLPRGSRTASVVWPSQSGTSRDDRTQSCGVAR
jgi:endonuclease G